MKAYFLLIALYTISGKQAVPSGDIPEGATCVYEQTDGRSGQLTAGNSLMLTLSGCEGMTLHSVTLRMHSNTKSGAGRMTMAIGEAPIWMIYDAPFSDESWYGDYSKEWVDISQSFSGLYVPQGDDITLQISASENSLYLQSVQLNYSAPQPKTYTVSFDTHIAQTIDPVTELEASGGILLPDIELDDADWRFYGWADEAVDECQQAPSVCRAGSMYFPSTDCTLHAVYVQESDVQPWLPTDDMLLEDYLIAQYEPGSELMLYATGPVLDNGSIAAIQKQLPMENGWVSMPTDIALENSIYTLRVKNDTLTIRHKATDTPVLLVNGGNFSGTSHTNNAWRISPSSVESDDMPRHVISGIAGGKLYYFSFYLLDYTVYFRPTSSAIQLHDLMLFAVSDRNLPDWLYTSYPSLSALTNTTMDGVPAYRMHIGSTILTIKNGKKYLQINE